ncbi:MAG: peroxiredoxin [bacterium]
MNNKILSIPVQDLAGKPAQLMDLKGSYVVLYVYPKDQTPGCTVEACEFRDFNNDIKKMGVKVIGISGDSVASHLKFQEKHQLNFTLWSDPERKLLTELGAIKQKSMFGNTFLGIIRSTYIFDPQGELIKTWPKVKPLGHAKEVYEYLKTVSGDREGKILENGAN